MDPLLPIECLSTWRVGGVEGVVGQMSFTLHWWVVSLDEMSYYVG